jgi:hypothetical protein
MDTRRASDHRENGSKPELGTETVPVELVELQSVGKSGRSFTRTAILAVAAIGIVAFAAIVATGRPPTSTPSPSAPVIGLASASPAPTPTVAPSLLRPTPPPPTPRPTPPPPWQWTRSDFLAELRPSVEGIWGVNGQILALVSRNDPAGDRESWSIVKLVEEGGWELLPAPPAIDGFFAGTVVDDRLWFFARVGSVSDADTTWQLVSTTDGMTWDSLGTAEGLPPLYGASILARAGDSWVIVTHRDDGEGASNAAISWSADGRHWDPADVPELRANVGYTASASIGDATVMVGFDFDSPEDAAWFVLRTTDGRTWRRSSFVAPSTTSARDLACDDRICLITLQPFDVGSSSTQALMVSTDGDGWAEVAANVPYYNPDSTIVHLATTATGFIALTGSPAHALLSTDGSTWRAVEVLPPDAKVYISDLAVAGDLVVAMVPWQTSDEPDRIWVGSLAAMDIQRR